jgi:chromosome partitioning protein
MYLQKIISISNQKGGVGKTTTAVNLSSCIANLGIKTLLIDIDPQANATTGMGLEPKDDGNSVYEILVSDKKAKDTIQKTQIENLFIIKSNINLVAAELELVSLENREGILRDTTSGLCSSIARLRSDLLQSTLLMQPIPS